MRVFGEKMDTFDGFQKSSFDGSNNTPFGNTEWKCIRVVYFWDATTRL